jgi:hypothetical protein
MPRRRRVAASSIHMTVSMRKRMNMRHGMYSLVSLPMTAAMSGTGVSMTTPDTGQLRITHAAYPVPSDLPYTPTISGGARGLRVSSSSPARAWAPRSAAWAWLNMATASSHMAAPLRSPLLNPYPR